MNNRRRILIFLTVCVFLLGLAYTTGCAKKQVQPQAVEVTGEAKGAQAQTQAGDATARTDTKPEPKPVVAPPREDLAVKGEGEAKAKPEAAAGPAAKMAVELRDINFDFDKSILRPDARAILKEHADWLLKNPEFHVLIEGHCDERGTEEYNLALGERRANETLKYLIELGVAKERLKTISYGEERPLDPGHNEEAWAKNRRAHFVISVK